MSFIKEIQAFRTTSKQSETLEDKFAQGKNVNSIPVNSGLMGTLTPRPNLTFRQAESNSVIQHKGAYIVLGGDRPGHVGTGTSAKGYTRSDAIDIVVGRGANIREGKGPPDGYIVGPLLSSDAARVYISESTNIDKNFGLALTPREAHAESNDHPLSGIGVKADNVRLIARNNIKIVTGRNQGFVGGEDTEKNVLGGRSPAAGTISLIGGNYTDSEAKIFSIFDPKGPIQQVPYLQPAIKGDNLVHCLESLYNYVDLIESVVFNLALSEFGLHISKALDPFESPVGRLANLRAMNQEVPYVLMQAYESMVRSVADRQDFLDYGGSLHIRSANVYLT